MRQIQKRRRIISKFIDAKKQLNSFTFKDINFLNSMTFECNIQNCMSYITERVKILGETKIK
jgi:hypothetical protein